MAAICAMPVMAFGLSQLQMPEDVAGCFPGREVAINRHLGEIGAEHVGERLQDDRDQRDRHLPAVGTQILQQPRHQAAVIGFA